MWDAHGVSGQFGGVGGDGLGVMGTTSYAGADHVHGFTANISISGTTGTVSSDHCPHLQHPRPQRRARHRPAGRRPTPTCPRGCRSTSSSGSSDVGRDTVDLLGAGSSRPRAVGTPARRRRDRWRRGVNEVTIGGTSPTDTSELWVDGTPALYAKIGGIWTPVSGRPARRARRAPPARRGVGRAGIPTNPTIELWYDTDAIARRSVSYVHNQGTPAATWVIDHNLGWYPNVIVEDSGGSTVEGEIVYTSASTS